MIFKIFLESFFAKMAYWLYSFKNYFRGIHISQPKQSKPTIRGNDSLTTKNATESLNAKGDGFVQSSDQFEMSQSDKDVLGYVSNSDF